MAATTQLQTESVGALLRSAREELGLTVHAVSLKTKIPEKYLGKFEQDAHDGLVDDVYTKIYLKAYGKFLGFETNDLLDHYNRARVKLGIPVRAPERDDRHPSLAVESKELRVTPKILQIVGLAVVVAALLGWIGLELKKIITPPAIALAAPRDGFITYDRTVAVEGTTESEVTLRINGKQVTPDDTGKFRDSLNLQEGVNVISVTGAKKHSKPMTVERRVIVMPRGAGAAPTAPVTIEEVPQADGTMLGTNADGSQVMPIGAEAVAAAERAKQAAAAKAAAELAARRAAEKAAVEAAAAQTDVLVPVTSPVPTGNGAPSLSDPWADPATTPSAH